MQRQKSSPYTTLIAAATGAPESRLTILERLMRDEIFHSTLDWQSAEELSEGARRANSLYLSAPAYYDAISHHQRSKFQLGKLESQREKALKNSSPAKLAELETRIALARDFEMRARQAIRHLAEHYALS